MVGTPSGKQEELALNPDHFIGRSDEGAPRTLVHEMVHAWQHQHGQPSARSYHKRGGEDENDRLAAVQHRRIAGGLFQQAWQAGSRRVGVEPESAHRSGPQGGRSSKTKFRAAGRMPGASRSSRSTAGGVALRC